jgi:predicted Co/Zn/Cd cation transporter (cation efflux family)
MEQSCERYCRFKEFLRNREEQTHVGNRANVDIYNCTDAKIANEARKLVEKKKTPEEIQKALNKEGSNSKVSVISGKYEKGQYDLVDKTDWSPD